MDERKVPIKYARRKTFIFIALGVCVLIATIFFVSWVTVMGGFARLERSFLERNITRAREVVSDRISNISSKLADWSTWDDTYAFIEDKNEAYIKSNLTSNALDTLKIDMMIFLDIKGDVVYLMGQGLKDLPAELKSYFVNGKALSHLSDERSFVSGLIALSGKPAMVVARPVLTSEGKGPVRGAMIFVDFLNINELRRLSQIIGVDIDVQKIEGDSLPVGFTVARKDFIKGLRVSFQVSGHQSISGYFMMEDISGKPDFITKVSMPREITLFGRQTLFLFFIALIVVGLIFGIAVYLPLDRELYLKEAAERKLVGLNEIFLQLAEKSGMVAWEVDAKGLYTYVSSVALRVYGYHPGELSGRKNFYDLHPEENREMFRQKAFAVFEKKESFQNFVNPVQRKDGGVIWVATNGEPLLNSDGTLKGYRGSDTDITRRKRAEDQLEENRLFLEETMRIANVCGWKANPRTDFLEWSQGVYDLVEAPKDHQPGLTEGLKYFLPEYISILGERILRCLDTGEPFSMEVQFRTGTGKVFWGEVRGIASISRDGADYVLGSVQDISERKLSQEALRLGKISLDLALKSAKMGVWSLNIATKKRMFDGLACSLLGIDSATFNGTEEEFFVAVHPDDQERIKALLARTINRGMPYEPNYRVIWPDGSVHFISARGELVQDAEGRPLMINGILWDVTQDKKAEEVLNSMKIQLLQADKLSTLGEMTTGLAHEINQPLGVISLVATSFRKLIDKKLLTDDKLAEGLKDIDISIKRMAKTVEHVRIYARQEVLDFFPMDVSETVEAALGLMGEQLRIRGVDLEKSLESGLPSVNGEPHQLEQVWINLISNARDAMDEKEKQIRQGKWDVPGYQKSLKISVFYDKDKGMVLVMFKDNGLGMNKQQMDKIFDPFFTTKEIGKGTGLGLSISQGIIDKHMGKIDVESQMGEGAAFKVYLPVINV
ncbi:MAG: PAS domain S-box protein [Candidatus Omnitrophica bacterium]|nr:PAS domain S-box protein [Candidatus Omnitrophota bacterium]